MTGQRSVAGMVVVLLLAAATSQAARPTTSLSGMSSNMRVTPAEARLLPGGGRRLLDDPQPKADTTGTPPDTPPGTEATGTQATTPTDGQPATGATPGQTQPGDQASTAGGQGTTGEGAGGPQPQAFCSVRCISEARAVRVDCNLNPKPTPEQVCGPAKPLLATADGVGA